MALPVDGQPEFGLARTVADAKGCYICRWDREGCPACNPPTAAASEAPAAQAAPESEAAATQAEPAATQPGPAATQSGHEEDGGEEPAAEMGSPNAAGARYGCSRCRWAALGCQRCRPQAAASEAPAAQAAPGSEADATQAEPAAGQSGQEAPAAQAAPGSEADATQAEPAASQSGQAADGSQEPAAERMHMEGDGGEQNPKRLRRGWGCEDLDSLGFPDDLESQVFDSQEVVASL